MRNLLSYDLNCIKSPDFSYWLSEHFNFGTLDNAVQNSHFSKKKSFLFGSPVSQLSMTVAEVTNILFNIYHHNLEGLHNAEAPLANRFWFINGIVRVIYRSRDLQLT